MLFGFLLFSFDLIKLLLCLSLCVGSHTISMSLWNVNFSTASHCYNQIAVFAGLCHVSDVYFYWEKLVELPLSIELVEQNSLTSFVDHAVTSDKKDSKVHLVRVLFEHLHHFGSQSAGSQYV